MIFKKEKRTLREIDRGVEVEAKLKMIKTDIEIDTIKDKMNIETEEEIDTEEEIGKKLFYPHLINH